jgi:hypothetical protein
VGADGQAPIDEHEAGIRRLTAAAYGFASWTEFRDWRRQNPKEYRARARLLMSEAHGGDDAIVVDLFAEARRRRAPSPRPSD